MLPNAASLWARESNAPPLQAYLGVCKGLLNQITTFAVKTPSHNQSQADAVRAPTGERSTLNDSGSVSSQVCSFCFAFNLIGESVERRDSVLVSALILVN